MMDERIGLRVELTEDIQSGAKGERGVIGEKSGYLGVVLDKRPGALIISHAGMPITNYLKVVDDERLKQQSLFGENT